MKALTYLTSCPDKQIVLSILCSLLNTVGLPFPSTWIMRAKWFRKTLKYNPASWRVPYDHVVFKDSKQVLINYSLQFLLVLILYPPPEKSTAWISKNYFRYFLGRLHRPQDFQFLVDGMTRVLKQPVSLSQSKASISVKLIYSRLVASQLILLAR